MILASAIASAPASVPFVRPRRIGRPPGSGLKCGRAERDAWGGRGLISEQVLWRTVLHRTLADAFYLDGAGVGAGDGAMAVAMRRARAWLTTPSADRDAVLLACDLDPDWFGPAGRAA